MLTVGSLFSGIGGIDLGLERAGMKVLWQVEKDLYAQRVLAKNFPGVACYDDILNVKGASVPYVDVLAGGFPCQDISVAGKGAGIKEGTRSGLWSEYIRIVRELRPRYVLVENVPALRSRGLDRVLGDLAASGYDAEWDCFPAVAFGAPHRRDRLFIVAYADRPGRQQQQRAFAATPEQFAAQCGGWWAAEPDVGRVAHGVPQRVDRLRCLGNAVVPQVAEYVGRCIVNHFGGVQ